MKLKYAKIVNFKGIKEVEVDFTGEDGTPRFLTCLVGDNGSGKTTVLQAIAFALSRETRQTQDEHDFKWNGFLPDRLETLGPTEIRLEIALEQDEQKALAELCSLWKKSHPNDPDSRVDDRFTSPDATVSVMYERPNRDYVSTKVSGTNLVVMGRYYLEQVSLDMYEAQKFSSRIGDVYWFDQYRVIGSGILQTRGTSRLLPHVSHFQWGPPQSREVSWSEGVASLREMLVGLWTFHKSEKKRGQDLIEDLEPMFARVFPGTRFVGVEPRRGVPRPTQKDFFFLLERNGSTYDIAELSSGEQAVFEILYEFVRLNISKSVVLIDELELHLHPPQQQALLAALPKLGPDCQFIITTHSPYLENAIPHEELIRLEGGRVIG